MILALTITLAVVVLFFLFGWLISLAMKKAVVVDVFWGLGGLLIAITAFFVADGDFSRRLLLLILVAAWALRLSTYLFFRVKGSAEEDQRYADMHSSSGKPFWLFTLTTVFLLQSIILWFNLLPVTVGSTTYLPVGLTAFDYLGLLFWLIGFIFQAVGDYQLSTFKKHQENSGKVLDTGLWRYTRHPNYFGEAVLWWGIYLIAAATDPGRWTILSPILMTFLLLKVSGVAMTEKYMSEKGNAFAEYKRRTSAFFPWPPRKTNK